MTFVLTRQSCTHGFNYESFLELWSQPPYARCSFLVHPKLRNINLHNVTHSLISQNPREQMFVTQISLLIVRFLSLIPQNLSSIQTTQEVNSHLHIATCVNMWSVTFLFLLFFLCHLLNVGACVHHIAQEGQVEWTTLSYVTGE